MCVCLHIYITGYTSILDCCDVRPNPTSNHLATSHRCALDDCFFTKRISKYKFEDMCIYIYIYMYINISGYKSTIGRCDAQHTPQIKSSGTIAPVI